MRSWLRLCLAAVAVLSWAGDAPAQGLTQDEALRLAFPPPAHVERRTAYLDAGQVARIKAAAGKSAENLPTVISYYVGLRDDRVVGTAYFDAHKVRTLGEVVMIVVGPAADVQRVEILKFLEPHDYRATPAWLAQFKRKTLTEDLSLKRGIANMTGASITSSSITNAVRRTLALHQVLNSGSAEK